MARSSREILDGIIDDSEPLMSAAVGRHGLYGSMSTSINNDDYCSMERGQSKKPKHQIQYGKIYDDLARLKIAIPELNEVIPKLKVAHARQMGKLLNIPTNLSLIGITLQSLGVVGYGTYLSYLIWMSIYPHRELTYNSKIDREESLNHYNQLYLTINNTNIYCQQGWNITHASDICNKQLFLDLHHCLKVATHSACKQLQQYCKNTDECDISAGQIILLVFGYAIALILLAGLALVLLEACTNKFSGKNQFTDDRYSTYKATLSAPEAQEIDDILLRNNIVAKPRTTLIALILRLENNLKHYVTKNNNYINLLQLVDFKMDDTYFEYLRRGGQSRTTPTKIVMGTGTDVIDIIATYLDADNNKTNPLRLFEKQTYRRNHIIPLLCDAPADVALGHILSRHR